MMTLKDMLLERKLNPAERLGCLMAMVDKSVCKTLLKFNEQIIPDDIIYHKFNEKGEDEFGREKECHVTIRFGFTKDLNELDVRQLIKGQKEFLVEVTGLNKFDTNPEFDVIKFSVESPILTKLNHVSGVHPNKTDFPDYHPHLTLAYVKKGTFPHVKKMHMKIPITSICYSPISGAKSYFTLDENTEQDIDSQIKQLENEWERLDATGTGVVRQHEIERELNQLRFEKSIYKNIEKQADAEVMPSEPSFVDPSKGKELFAKMRQAIA